MKDDDFLEGEDDLAFNPFFEWIAFWRTIKHRNRFHLPPQSEAIVKKTVSLVRQSGTSTIAKGDTLFRCRIHEPVDDRTPPWSDVREVRPYAGDQIGAPPAPKCSAGRLNPRGIPYLYLADSPETALAEMRPWPGAHLTVGSFIIQRSLTVADFTPFVASDSGRVNVWLRFVGRAISIPQHPEDPLGYLPTQYIAELFKAEGFDGIRYPSAMKEGGLNTALFDPEVAKHSTSQVVQVTWANYAFDSIQSRQT